ncbi:unnamed protein product [Polarella glacialis]|uniref:Uncharacterized protein n=1 Tax=Polarella glacialis TaxID=89957 RepID=A0A813F4Z0_POLGL|nr:unnamed protein product [Polarella glacialis]
MQGHAAKHQGESSAQSGGPCKRQEGNDRSKGMSQEPCAQGVQLAVGSDSDADTSSDDASEVSHMVGEEDTCQDLSEQSAEEEMYALPWHPFDDGPEEKVGAIEAVVWESAKSEDEAPFCGSAAVAASTTATATSTVGDQGFKFDGEGKQRHSVAGRKNRHATGVGCSVQRGQAHYQAKMSIKGIVISGRYRHDLDSALSDHVMLMQVREAILTVFQRRGLNFKQGGAHWNEVAAELSEVVNAILIENSADGEIARCACYARMSMGAFVGKDLPTPNTRSVVTCLEHDRLVQEARDVGWPEVRKAFIELSQHVEPRGPSTGRGNAIRSPTSVAATLDALYDRYAARRTEREALATAREQKNKQHEETRTEREAFATARREQKNKQHEETTVRLKTLRSFSRLARRAETALNAVHEKRRRLAQLEDTQMKKQARQEQQERKRQEQQERKRRAELRRQWLRQRDLTMDEIMRGPPSL